MIVQEKQSEKFLKHYGTPRKSGRYPWGSGNSDAVARHRDLNQSIEDFKKQGMSEAEIAKALGFKNTTEMRNIRSITRNQAIQQQINQAQKLADKGWSTSAIARHMGLPESTVRSRLDPGAQDRQNIMQATSNMLKDQIDSKGYIDVGKGVENQLGISDTKLKTSVAQLQQEGYKMYYVKVQQVGTGKETTVKVLCKDDMPYPKDFSKIHQIEDTYSDDGGRSFLGVVDPLSIDSKRVGINYAEDGGADEDGVIYVRPGVKDLSMGANHYAQVRIMVDGTHYMKGMAVYKDDLPDGVDLVFNTNKSKTTPKMEVLKEVKDDPDNPFGATIKRQITEGEGNDRHCTSALNMVNEEGDWGDWSKSLSAQMLSKQNPELAKRQLDMMHERQLNEFKEINKLTNPQVKQMLLEKYADGCDSAAVHMKAASMPGQANKVILPVKSLKDNEVYAPGFKNGDKIVLIRYPHAGTFEIPELTVNNRNPEAKKMMGTSTPDAIGINHHVAERLSGADFDGDTVLAIPNNRGSIKSSPALKGLKGFDPSHSYPPYDGMRTIDGGKYNAKTGKVEYSKRPTNNKQREMGTITNLISDMTIQGASDEELARAVRHSMVVIDSEKHALDYKESYRDNNIAQLKEKYQGSGGSATLITRAGSPEYVSARKLRPASQGGPIDPKTGKKVYVLDERKSYTNAKGEKVYSKVKSTKGAETDDAYTLVSKDGGTKMESIYADYSNSTRALANQARKESLNTVTVKKSPSAEETYKPQVESLNAKLNAALKNAPRERQAQLVANYTIQQKKQANPSMDPDEIKKISNQALAEARERTGAGKTLIGSEQAPLTQDEWDAIQAGALSPTKVKSILDNSDIDRVRELATPRESVSMTATNKARAQAWLDLGYTQAEVAENLGVSVSTLENALKS